MTHRGAFITIEGGEGVGKSSSLAAIEAWLSANSIDAVLTREPGGTELGEQIRSWILDGDHGALGGEVEALLMFAARSRHLSQVIRPAMEQGRWIVCDRFTDATIAYQGHGRGVDIAFLEQIARGVQRDLKPDLTILLDAPAETGLARIADREHDHFEREQRDFFLRVRDGYLDLASQEPERFRIVDATQSLQAVQVAIEAILGEFLRRYRASPA